MPVTEPVRVQVRPASSTDEVGVGAVLRASYPRLLAGHYPVDLLAAVLPLMCVAQARLLACPTWYVALDANEGEPLIGCGGWTAERPGAGTIEPGLGHLRHFATHPDHLRRGVGRAIADASFASARAAGITRLECYATRPSVDFYAALGFAVVAEIGLTMPARTGPEPLEFPAVHMAMSLA